MTMKANPTYEELERRVQELETDYTQLEKKQHEAELFSEEIMTYMSEGFVQTDIRGNIIFINQRLSEMLGYLPEEIIGKWWLDMVPIEQHSIAKEADARRAKGHTDQYEIILRRKDGHKFPVMIGAGPRFDKQSNEFIGTMGVVSDITERKLTEEALRESEARFKALHNASFGGIAIHDQGIILECNQGLSEMTGYQYSELIGMNGLLLIAEKSRETVMNNIRTGYEKSYEAFGLRKNGEEFPIQLEARNVPYKGKQVRTVEFRDITERKRAEEELKRSEENYRLLVENQTDLVVKVDLDGRFLFVSPSYCRMFDKKETEILGRHFMPLVHEDDREPTAKAMETLFLPPHTAYIEQRAMTKEGWCWLAWVDTAVLDKAGHVKEIIGVGRDITELKRTEETLKSNYALLQIAGETAIFGGWSVDLENNICAWSDAVADIHDVPRGYAPPVQEGINFYAPEWREKITQCFNACAKDGIPYDEEMEIITQKGKRVWVRTTAKALKNTNGRIIKVQGSFQDITERKRAEESRKKYEKELEERNLFIQTVLDNLPIGLAVNSIDEGKATYINKKFEEIYGWPKHLLENTEQFFDKVYPDPEYREKIKKRIFEDIKSGDPERMVWDGIETTRNDGEKRIVSAKNIALHEQNFMISTVQDITENRKLQAQLTQAQKMESVGRLAGGVAHDFNNMLGVILGHTELALLKTDEDKDLVFDLKEIQKAAKRSADTTKQLLAFARKEIISPRQIELNDTVESMLNMLRRLIGEDIHLVWQPGAHLWPVKMDPSQIDQILVNLCVNARDAISGVGKLTIETKKNTFDEAYCKEHPDFIPGDFVLLAVSDNGCGMDKETLENLFEPFFTTKEVGKGTGLGLATIYGIVKQNNGFINVYSEPGQGSTFKIYLPRLVADEDADKAVCEKKAAAGGTETILLVEDEATMLRMTRMMLERKGYSVLSAATPGEAIDLAKTYTDKIHLLMTDVVMPEMNGRDLAGQITALYPDIRLLFMSGYSPNVIAHQGVLDDGVAFIQKPFSMEEMTEKVREILDVERF